MTEEQLKDAIVNQAVELSEKKNRIELLEFLREYDEKKIKEFKNEIEGLKESGKCSDTLLEIYEKENDDLKAKISELQAQGAEPFEEVMSE